MINFNEFIISLLRNLLRFKNALDFEVIWYSLKESKSESEGDSSDVSCLKKIQCLFNN